MRHPARRALRSARSLRLSVAVVLGLSCALGLSPVAAAAPPAAAAPATPNPTTPDGAQQAWLDAAQQYASFGERVLAAESVSRKAAAGSLTAQQRWGAARAQVTAGRADVAAAQQKVTAAEAAVSVAGQATSTYQQQIDSFTDASFRGARFGTMSAFLTATSPDDFLEQASTMNVIADDNADMLAAAKLAQQKLIDARASAQHQRNVIAAALSAARAREQDAATTAQAAHEAAQQAIQARRSLAGDKKALAGRITAYQRTYARLSAADRHAAVQLTEGGVTVRGGEVGATSVSVQDLSVRAARLAPNPRAAVAVQAALSRVGLPYVWGATGPNSFDCSGLMLWSWAKAGISIPRSSAEQAASLRVIPLSDVQVGDLITFYQPTSHVGMYIGEGLFVHASHTGAPLMVTSLSKRINDHPVAHAVGR